jgi:tetratricopeptide (TPR) repeat protein
LSAQAKAAFEAKRYTEAVRLYEEAYQIEPLATLLYNIAFIYDTHLGNQTLAGQYYRRYVNAPDAEKTAQVRAYERLAVFRATRKRSAAFAPLPPVSRKPVAPPSAAPPSVAAAPPSVAGAPTAEPTVTGTVSPAGEFPWKPVLLGVAGAGLLTGAVFTGLTASTHTDYQAARDEPERGDLSDTGKTQALVADLAFGVGIAAGAAGLLVWLLDDDDTTAIAPTTIGDVPGVFVGRRF